VITKIIITRDGTDAAITVDQWKTLSLPERVGFISKSSVRFYNGAGEISARDALAALKN
jgi:hypothetical protein